jgi:hypothetical protein
MQLFEDLREHVLQEVLAFDARLIERGGPPGCDDRRPDPFDQRLHERRTVVGRSFRVFSEQLRERVVEGRLIVVGHGIGLL